MKIVVFIEKHPTTKRLRDVSVELAAKAYSLLHAPENPLDGEVVGVFVGDELPENTEMLFAYGMDRLVCFKHPQLANLQAVAYKHTLEAMIRQENPDIVLFGATHTGRELAPLVSSSLGTGLTADCTQLHIDDYKDKGKILFQVRPAFGGNILATIITPDHRPMMASVRENVMQLPQEKPNRPVRIQDFHFTLNPTWIRNEFLSIIPKTLKIHLPSAQIIVAGGAGAGSRDGFALVEALARAFGAETGASRAAIDFGYTEKDRLIGQTGAVVRPKLYIACGISGSIQHRAGMEESKKIVAINTDPNAPIFKVAHLGIVGDLREVIPVMLKCLKED